MKIRRLLSVFLSAALLCGTAVTGPASAADTAGDMDAGMAKEHAALSRRAAGEGMVLLKNEDGALPIAKGGGTALFGPGQIDFLKGGWGSGDVTAEVTNLLEGMERKAGEGKIKLDESLAARYKQDKNFALTGEIAAAAAKKADTAVVVISRNSGEGYDRSPNKGDYYLSDSETSMLSMVSAAGFRHIAVVLNIGGVIDTSWIGSFPAVDAVLVAWQPGMEGGLAAADILVGDVNPSGKLTDTLAKSYNDYPSSAGFYAHDKYVDYTEDVYVGYRYFETFDPGYDKVNYEFGFGLSYTSFSIDQVKAAADGENVTVTAEVKNTGRTAGKEVVQVYYGAPQGKLGKPAKELAAFQKTGLIQPGQTETVTLSFPIADMASYDDLGKIQKSAYVLEKGDYEIYVGNSVKDAGRRGSRFTYKVAADTVTEQLSEQVAPIQLEERLVNDGSGQAAYEELPQPDWYADSIPRGGVKIDAQGYYKKQEHVTVVFNEDATKSGMYMQSSDRGNRWLCYAVKAPAAGEYAVTLGVGNGGNASRNSLKLYVGTGEQSEAQEMPQLTIPSTGGQFDFKDFGSFTVNLKQGLNFLTVSFTDANYTGMLESVFIQPGAGDFQEEEPEPAEAHKVAAVGTTKIEAEEFSGVEGNKDIGPEDAVVGGEKIGVSVKALDTPGAVLEYALDVEKAGKYDLVMRASSGSGDKKDCMDVLVGGVKQDGIVCNIPNTGTSDNLWFNFIDVGPYTVELPAGRVVLRFEFKNFGNLDSFTFAPAAEQAAVTSVTAGKAASAGAEKILFKDVYEDPSLLDAFIAQLTAAEIVSMTHGHGSNLPDGTGSIGYLPDYGVPGAETADGPAGIRRPYDTTAFPIATLLACTWNTALLEEVGKAAGAEAKEAGADIWLAPALNIHRNPMCGRNFEYYSEDPLVSGKMAAAITRGTQSEKVAVTVKHFAANNKETNRGAQDSRMSERAMREIYLKGFEICIKEAAPWCLMTSYNSLNGVETSENPELLTNILREEWGFDGLVMTDWNNDSLPYREIKAGNEVKMQGQETPPHVYDAARAGWITREELERTASRILSMILKTNAMERTSEAAVWHEVTAAGTSRIKAADYAWKSDGISWLRYNIRVEKAGTYICKARFASPGGGGGMDLLLDDEKIGSFGRFDGTGGWQTWQTSGPVTVTLAAGEHDLRINFLSDGANLNWLEFERVQPELEVTVSPRDASVKAGSSVQLSAQVGGSGADGSETVKWSVSGGHTGTSIDGKGLLTAADDETASTLTVTATIVGTRVSDAVTVYVLPAEKPILPGDLDANGVVNITDVMLGCRVLARKANHQPPSEEELARGDMDRDGYFTITDIMMICKVLADKN